MPLLLSVAATSANLGPGFDCLGLALARYNRYRVRPGGGAYLLDGVPWGGRRNLFLEGAARLATELGRALPPFDVEVTGAIPLGRGLGSSASATVAGLVAANLILDARLDARVLLRLATELEGHPDNVAPALLGGVTVAVQAGEAVEVLPLELPVRPELVLAIPAFELATQAARAALPAVVPLEDAVYNVARAALLTAALASGRLDSLILALGDRLHQPYRAPLVPGMLEVQAAARAAGAWGVTLSGAGPSLLAWCPPGTAAQVARSMETAWRETGQEARVEQVAIARAGVIIEEGAWP